MKNHCHPNFEEEGDRNQRALTIAVVLTFGYGIVEAIVGWKFGSLALLSDAGHMFTDSTALLMAWVAGIFMRRPPSEKHSYGFARIEVITALANAFFMLLVIATISYEAFDRIWHPVEVNGSMVFVVAVVGLIVNLIVAFKLSHAGGSHGHANLNTRAALVHVVGDLLGSVAAILAGLIIYLTGWMPIDPILSMIICLIVIRSVYQLLKESFLVLMEGVPDHIDLYEVNNFLNQVDNVTGVSDLHIWNLSSGYIALTAHVRITDLNQWPRVLDTMQKGLNKEFGIRHITVQPEL